MMPWRSARSELERRSPRATLAFSSSRRAEKNGGEPVATPNDHDWHEVGGRLSSSGSGEVGAVMVIGALYRSAIKTTKTMSIIDHNAEAELPFPKEKVYAAILLAIPTIDGMKIDSADEILGRVVVKAGMSIWSWGENIPITLSSGSNGNTKIAVLSTPKTGIMLGGALDMGKNRKNIEKIFSAISKQLGSMK